MATKECLTIPDISSHLHKSISECQSVNFRTFPRTLHSPLADAWRKTFVSASKRRSQQLLDTSMTSIIDTAKWSTCLESIDMTPYFAVGSGAKTNNLFILENTAVNKLDAVENYTPPVDSLVLKSAFSLPGQIFDLSSIGDILVTAEPNGLAQIYKVELQDLGTKGKGITHVQECVIGDTAISNVISPPGVLIQSTRLKCIELEPTSAPLSTNRNSDFSAVSVRRVSVIQSKKVHLYDLPTSKVICSVQPGNKPLNKVVYSSHAPFGSLMAVGGHDMNLYLMDSRIMRSGGENSQSTVVWKTANAHFMPIMDIKFNPFIPYWVASSDAGGAVKVWDIRYAAGPSACINGHFDSVNSIAWSNTHCDIISFGSSDRAWRAWSIQPDQLVSADPTSNMFIGFPGSDWGMSINPNESAHAVIGSKIIGEHQTDYTAPIVSVIASNTHADTFLTLSAAGEIMSHTIRSNLLEQLAIHRYDDISARNVETKIYARNLTDTFQCLTKYLRAERPTGEMTAKHEQELIELVTKKPPLTPAPICLDTEKQDLNRSFAQTSHSTAANTSLNTNEDWFSGAEKHTDTRDMVVAFREDLETYGYGLPPGYGIHTHNFSIVDKLIQSQFDLTVMRFKIVDQVLQGNWQAIIDNEKALYSGMETDSELLDCDTIQFFTEELITHSLLKGMTMVLKFGELVADTPKAHFENLASTMGLLLFPTVYDSAEWLPDLQSNLAAQPQIERQATIEDYVSRVRRMRLSFGEDIVSPTIYSGGVINSAVGSLGSPVTSGVSSTPQTQYLVPSSPRIFPKEVTLLRSNSSKSLVNVKSSPVKPTGVLPLLSKVSIHKDASGSNLFRELYMRKHTQILRVASEPKEILPMISLEIRLIKIAEKQSENIDEEIVQAMQQNVMTDSGVSGVRGRGGTISSNASMLGGPIVAPFERTISATANRLYVDALLATKRFEDYFGATIDLIVSQPTSDFSRMLFKLIEVEGVPKLKTHIDTLYTTATNHLQAIFSNTSAVPSGPPNPMTSKSLVQGSKLLRDAMIVLVKSAAHIMQGQELLRSEKLYLESLMRQMTQLTASMLQLSGMLSKSFEHFDKQLGKGNQTTREWAQTVHDSLRDAARTFPLSANKARPTQLNEKAATGHTIHEEVFSTLDKLYRGFIKPDAGQSA
ncbi:hypothetical protein MT418_005345 [Batrachochytrium dendrobatidis]